MKERLRIVFVNLHSDWMLLRVPNVYIFKNSAAIKHEYLLRYLLKHPDRYEVINYINERGSTLTTQGNPLILKIINLTRFLENRLTMRENHIKNSEVKVIRSPRDIKKEDLVITYNLLKNEFIGLNEINAFKATSMLHFHGGKEEVETIQKAGIACLFGESDLRKNSPLFQKYYKELDLPWIIHPFVFADRFINTKPFSERKNMAFATGTITYYDHEEFLDVYKDSCDQPIRKMIKDNPEFFNDTIYCTSSDYLEGDTAKRINPNDFILVNLYKRIYNKTHLGKQKNYFSFDMVEMFNDFKMCVVGEEVLGVPGIGFVEGMACGCAYIGIDSPMYRDLGLIPGVHYITHDGTKEGLKRVIEYYQAEEHQDELEKIAAEGCRFVRENFKGDVVAKSLMNELIIKQKEWLRDDDNGICSNTNA